jgi:exonuclease III
MPLLHNSNYFRIHQTLFIYVISISIATININGLRDDKKRRTFFDWLISKKINVICVQETHCTFSEIESWQNLWKSSGGCESSWNCGVRASRGVGVLLYDIDATVKEISSDDFGRILSCVLKYENKTYIITNVYCPNDSGVRKTFIRDIDPYVTETCIFSLTDFSLSKYRLDYFSS